MQVTKERLFHIGTKVHIGILCLFVSFALVASRFVDIHDGWLFFTTFSIMCILMLLTATFSTHGFRILSTRCYFYITIAGLILLLSEIFVSLVYKTTASGSIVFTLMIGTLGYLVFLVNNSIFKECAGKGISLKLDKRFCDMDKILLTCISEFADSAFEKTYNSNDIFLIHVIRKAYLDNKLRLIETSALDEFIKLINSNKPIYKNDLNNEIADAIITNRNIDYKVKTIIS